MKFQPKKRFWLIGESFWNEDYFSQYVTEDFKSYIKRKRENHCHGNHIEMQAMCEMYNRTIEVYQTSIAQVCHTSLSLKPENYGLYEGSAKYESSLNSIFLLQNP